MLEQDDALAAETASKKNEDAARLEGRAGTSRMDRLADLTDMVLAIDSKSWLWLFFGSCYEIVEAVPLVFHWRDRSSITASCCIPRLIRSLFATYLLRLRLVLRRVELLSLLCVVRYCPLALAECLRLMFSLGGFLLGRHADCSEQR